jgi:hypothetical protein
MTLSDARRRLSATHQLALRCLAEGDDDLVAAERLGVPYGIVHAVVAEAGAALHQLLTDAIEPRAAEPSRTSLVNEQGCVPRGE